MIKQKELRPYKWAKLISGDLTGFEKEMHQEGVRQSKRTGLHSRGNVAIPYEILEQRDLTVGTDSQGGYTVATDLKSASFIELLQNKMAVKKMGATLLTNLVGDIAVPKLLTGAVAEWEGENDAAAESSPTFGQVAMAPNRVGTYVDVSNKLSVQSSLSINYLIKDLVSTSIAHALDLAALHGTGANDQPLGLAGTSNVGSVVGGTDGAAPTWANIIEFETDVAAANGNVNDSTMGFITNAKVRGKLKGTVRTATYGEIPLWGSDNLLNGYKAEVSNQVASNLEKGSSGAVCSAIFFGDWSQLIIGQWGGLDLVVDPYTNAKTNMTSIIANAYFDIAVKHPESFSIMLDCPTT